MRKVSRDSPTQPPYNLSFKHTTMAKLSYFGFEDTSIEVSSTVVSVVPRERGSKTAYLYKCKDTQGVRHVAFGDELLKEGDKITISLAQKKA